MKSDHSWLTPWQAHQTAPGPALAEVDNEKCAKQITFLESTFDKIPDNLRFIEALIGLD